MDSFDFFRERRVLAVTVQDSWKPQQPPSQPTESDSRILAMTREIMGAQATAKMFQELWATISDERKAEMANALADHAVMMIRSNHSIAQEFFVEKIRPLIVDMAERHLLTVRDAVAEKFSIDYVKGIVRKILDDAERQVVEDVVKKLKDAIRGPRGY